MKPFAINEILARAEHIPGKFPEQLLLGALLAPREPGEVIVIHHVTDTRHKLQLEVERRGPTLGIKFERVVL
jgi:hypothetical protein